MKVILKDNTEFEVASFAYGMNEGSSADKTIPASLQTCIASINIVPDNDTSVQRQVNALCAAFADENISEIRLTSEGIPERTYTFTRCICCQSVMTEGRDYIFVQLA